MPRSFERAASSGGIRTIRWHVGFLVVLLAAVTAATTGWFSADEVVMRQQSEALNSGSWAVQPDPEASQLDPDHSFALLARSDRIGAEVAQYTKHPAAAVLFAAGTGIAGDRGLYLGGLVSLLGTAILFARRFDWSPLAFWMPVLATTSLFHASVVWAHLPALLFAAIACDAAFDRHRSITIERAITATAAVIVVALLRSEGLLLGAALSAGLVVAAGSGSRLRVRSILPFLGAVATYFVEPLVREAWFGAGAAPLSAPVAGSVAESFVAGRMGVARVMLIEPSIEVGLGQARLVGALLLVAGSAALRAGRLRASLAPIVFGGAAVMYAVGILGSPIPGLLVAMPVIAASIPWMSVEARVDRGIVTAVAAFVVAVVLTSYDNAGGGDWGARYLFVGVPLLLLLAIPAVERVLQDSSSRSLVVGALVCGLAVQVGILEGLASRGSTVETVDSVRRTVESELTNDPGLVVAVSDERLSRFLYDRGLRGPSFHVPPAVESDFNQLIDPNRILWVDLGEQSDRRIGQTVATAGSVVIRTEVRR